MSGNRHAGKLVVALAALLCGACGATDTAADATRMEQRHLVVDGQRRSYRFYKVNSNTGQPIPLVLVFHGGQGDGDRIARQTGFHRVAAQHGFSVAYPDALDYWQDGRSTTGSDDHDVRFVRQLIAKLAATDAIDHRRVYATGASNGGMFTLRLACEANDAIAAFAPVIASFPVSYVARCNPGRPVPVLMINGTDDRLIKWRGGSILKGPRRGVGGTVIAVDDTLRFWQRNNRCQAAATSEPLPDIAADDGTTASRIRYPGCAAGSEVELVRIDGGGHTWPSQTGGPAPKARRLVGNTSRDYDASSEIWAFFSRHALR